MRACLGAVRRFLDPRYDVGLTRRAYSRVGAVGAAIALLVSMNVGLGVVVVHDHLKRSGGYQPAPNSAPLLSYGAAPVPAQYSLERYIVRRHNQGVGNSCVEQALTEGMELYTAEAGRPTWLSTGFLYNAIAPGGGTTSFQEAFYRAETAGIAPYSEFPNDAIDYWLWPPASAAALSYRVTSWYNVNPSDQTTIKGLIASGHPLEVATAFRDTLYNHGPGSAWISYDVGTLHFYHAQLIVAYNAYGVAVLNSWPGYGVDQIVWWTWGFLATAANAWNGGGLVAFYPNFSITRPVPKPAATPRPTPKPARVFHLKIFESYRRSHHLKDVPAWEWHNHKHGLTWPASIAKAHPHLGGIRGRGSWHQGKPGYDKYVFVKTSPGTRSADVYAWPATGHYTITWKSR